MGFNFFKKKKPEYDATNMRITDLRVGAVVDYDLKNWEVTREYRYDWGDEFFTREIQLKSADEVCYLHMEEDDELELVFSRKVNVHALLDDFPGYMSKNQQPPSRLEYKGRTYYRQSENPGYFQETGGKKWQEFISWDYRDESEKWVLSIEQWDDDEFEASAGQVVAEYEFSNLLPGGTS